MMKMMALINSKLIYIEEYFIVLKFNYYNELKCKAIDSLIASLIRERKLFLNYFGSGYIYFTSILILMIIGSLIREPLLIKQINIFFITVLSIVLIILAILSYYFKFNLRNMIILRKKRYGFYKRNKDKIIVGIIVAIIPSLITVLIGYFISPKIK